MDHNPPNLTVSTDLSPSSSSLGFTTPVNSNITLKDFCIGVKLAPPAKAESITMATVAQKVNVLFAFTGSSWDDLDPHEQAKMAFLYLRKQFDLANILRLSLGPDSSAGKRLHAYIRKGVDLTVDESVGHVLGAYENFVKNNDEWLDAETCPTIFNNPNNSMRVAKPLIWLQEETSMDGLLHCRNCSGDLLQPMHPQRNHAGRYSSGYFALRAQR